MKTQKRKFKSIRRFSIKIIISVNDVKFILFGTVSQTLYS